MPYEIDRREIPHGFFAAYGAAAKHLHRIGQGGLWWLRNHLHQPMAEHCSFRLGNQLFFVFVEVPGLMDFTDRERRLLLMVAEEAKGNPCLLPMRRSQDQLAPVFSGWGLVDPRTGEPIDPPALVSDELIEMTDWEVHDFAVEIVRASLEREKEILSWQPSPHISPSIFFMDGDERCFAMVGAARYPSDFPAMPHNAQEYVASVSRMGPVKGYFASVVFMNGEQEENGLILPLYRGHSVIPAFEGLQPL